MSNLLALTAKAPKTSLILVMLLTGFFASQLPNLKIDSTTERMRAKDDPKIDIYDKVIEKFGSDDVTTIFFKHEDLYTPERLKAIHSIVEELSFFDEIEKIESLFTTTNFYQNQGVLETVPLFEIVPDSQEEVDKSLELGKRNPLFKNMFFGDHFDSMTVHLFLVPNKNDPEYLEDLYQRIEKLLAEKSHLFDDAFQVGKPSINIGIKELMVSDFQFFVPISILIILFLLFLSVGDLQASFLPAITGGLSVIWTLGFMVLLDIPFSMLAISIPAILLIIGSTEDTHIIVEFMEGLEQSGNRKRAIKYLSRKISLAIILTSTTTIFGFFSIMANEIVMLYEFGLATGLGVFANFVITCTVIPAYLTLFGRKSLKSSHGDDHQKRSGVFPGLGSLLSQRLFVFVSKNHKWILVSGVLLMIPPLIGIDRLRADNDPLKALSEEHPVRQQIDKISNNIVGNNTMYLHLKLDEGNFRDPLYLKKVFELNRRLEKIEGISKVQSYADIIALINREMREGKPEQFEIPNNEALISQYELFLSVDDTKKYLTYDQDETNLIIWYADSNSQNQLDFKSEIEKISTEVLGESAVTFQVTGYNLLTAEASKTMINSQIESIILITITVFVLVSLYFMNPVIGLISIIPNLGPIFFLFKLMIYLDIPLDMGTCNVAAIAIGVAIDDTIHFFVRYNQSYNLLQDKMKAIQATIQAECLPVLSTSASLSLGLFTLVFSDFIIIQEFGFFTSYVVVLALVFDLLVTPSLLILSPIKGTPSFEELRNARHSSRVLGQSVVFQGLSTDSIKELFLTNEIELFEKNEEIDLVQGNFYLLISGKATLSKKSLREADQNKNITLTQIESGNHFKGKEDQFLVFEQHSRVLSISGHKLNHYLETETSDLHTWTKLITAS